MDVATCAPVFSPRSQGSQWHLHSSQLWLGQLVHPIIYPHYHERGSLVCVYLVPADLVILGSDPSLGGSSHDPASGSGYQKLVWQFRRSTDTDHLSRHVFNGQGYVDLLSATMLRGQCSWSGSGRVLVLGLAAGVCSCSWFSSRSVFLFLVQKWESQRADIVVSVDPVHIRRKCASQG